MTNIVNFASGKPGVGKTQCLIDDPEGNTVLALPTKILADDNKKRMEQKNKKALVINSDTHKGVKQCVENELMNLRNTNTTIIITHATLVAINPRFLAGWKLVIDEVPDITNMHNKPIGQHFLKDSFDHLITWDEHGEVRIQDGKQFDVLSRHLESVNHESMGMQALVFGALLKHGAEVKIKVDKVNKKRYWIEVIDHHDYKSIIKACDEFHVMGNAIEKSLFAQYVKAQGFVVERSKYTPPHKPYCMTPTLVPLFADNRYSWTMLVEGSDDKKMGPGTVGYEAVERALSYIGDQKVLFQGNTWMSEPGAYPFKGHDNVIVIPGDARGLNTFSNIHHSIHMMHGNLDHNINYSRMLELMSVDDTVGKAAIQHEQSIERTVQGITRTPIRRFEEQQHSTVHVVSTYKVAKKLERELGISCNYDLSIMKRSPKTVKKTILDEKKQRAWELHLQGKSYRTIGEELGMSPAAISNWINEQKQLENLVMTA